MKKKIQISDISTCSIQEMIEITQSKLKNTKYPTAFDKDCDEAVLRTLKLVLDMGKTVDKK
jgi:hypothetical protein